MTLRADLAAGLKLEHATLSSPSLVFVLAAAPWDQWSSHGFLSVLVTLPQLVDVQINGKSPLSFKKSCRRLFLTGFFSSVSSPADPHHARSPGCKRSSTRSYGAETNSWQHSEPLGSRMRCQSQRGGKEHLSERLSAGGRWMRWEFHFITAATQSKTLPFVLTGKSSKCEHLNQQCCIRF